MKNVVEFKLTKEEAVEELKKFKAIADKFGYRGNRSLEERRKYLVNNITRGAAFLYLGEVDQDGNDYYGRLVEVYREAVKEVITR